MDFSGSKENAKMLVERFIETDEQPDFMEFLCFRSCFIEANFYGYGASYVISNFHIYAGISQKIETITDSISGNINKVEGCYCPCDGKDLIQEVKKYNLDFAINNGKLQFVKKTREKLEVEYDNYGYYSSRDSKVIC